MFLANAYVGPLFLFTGAGFLLLLGAIIYVEALILKALEWGSLRRCLRDSVLINMASAAAGLVLAWQTTLFSPPSVRTLGVTWAISVVIEAGVLLLLRRTRVAATWWRSVATNTATYTALLFLSIGVLW